MTFDEFCERYNINNLSEQQEKALKRVNGATLLLAVPGSGKTTVVVARTGYLVHVQGIDPYNILTLTYTKAAASEMRQRYLEKFEPDGAQGKNVPSFSTINSFCVFVIRIGNTEKGVHVPTLLANNANVIRSIAVDMTPEYPSDLLIRELSQKITACKNLMYTETEIAEQECTDLNFGEFYQRYIEEMKKNDWMDFDDQLIMAYEILNQYPDLLERARSRFQYISLDEAQDTSLIQHKITQLLVGPKGNIFMVGDEDQSIYGFRGAFPKALLEFENDYDNDPQVLYMETNYRSDVNLVHAADKFIRRNEESRRPKNLVAYSNRPGKIEMVHVRKYEQIPEFVLSSVQAYLGFPDETIAFLYRNLESVIPVIALFQAQGMENVKVRGNVNEFLTTGIIVDILSYLKLAMNPRDMEAFRRIYSKFGMYMKSSVLPLLERGIRRDREIGIFKYAASLMETAKYYHKLRFFELVFDKIARSTPLTAIDLILDVLDYKNNWMQKKVAEGHSFASMMNKIRVLKGVARLYDNLPDFMQAVEALGSYSGLSPEEPEEGELVPNVLLSTIHSSKGLEYDSVVLIDPLEGVIPTFDSEHKSAEESREEVRLFYVAATRARHRLCIISPQTWFGQDVLPSRFVKEFVEAEQEMQGTEE